MREIIRLMTHYPDTFRDFYERLPALILPEPEYNIVLRIHTGAGGRARGKIGGLEL